MPHRTDHERRGRRLCSLGGGYGIAAEARMMESGIAAGDNGGRGTAGSEYGRHRRRDRTALQPETGTEGGEQRGFAAWAAFRSGGLGTRPLQPERHCCRYVHRVLKAITGNGNGRGGDWVAGNSGSLRRWACKGKALLSAAGTGTSARCSIAAARVNWRAILRRVVVDVCEERDHGGLVGLQLA